MRLFGQLFKLFLLLLLAYLPCNSYGQSYGLAFSSHEVFQDKRTGLDLTPDKPVCFNDSFNLSFDLSFIPNRETYFGYIIRLIEDDKRNIDLVYDAQSEKRHFNIIVGDKLSHIVFDIDRNKLFNQWIPINLQFDVDKDQIILTTGKIKLTETGLHLKKNACYKILFGINNYKQFQTTDTPPMKLRDVKITQSDGLKYNWPLSEENGAEVRELITQNNGVVTNPQWVTAMHRNWQAAQSVRVNGTASIAFNADKEELYVVGTDSVYTYAVGSGKWKNSSTQNNKLELSQGNQSVFNPFNSTLYNFFPDMKFVTQYNFQTNSWDKKFAARPVTSYWHLNKFFSGRDTSLYFIGGYGHLVYKSTISQYHIKTGVWDDVKAHGDFFMPRYLAALGATAKGDTAYILGGYGSTSGQQILNPQNTYDMMRFTVKDRTFKKMFTLKPGTEDFAFANSLVIDDKAKTYYGLIFPQHKYNSTLQLISGSLTKPGYTLMGSAIPYDFHDTHSFADLYYCPASKRFIAVTLLRSENNQTRVNVYTLLGPPFTSDNADGVVVSKTGNWYFIALAIIVVVLVILYLLLRKRKLSLIEQPAAFAVPTQQAAAVPANTLIEKAETPAPEVEEEPADEKVPYKNAILLFGDLQVFDAEGTDITKYFTPLIKELFLVILLYSIRWDRGLSSEKLNEILWYDKDAKSARNNRSVNIAKLKLLLDKMEHCQLSKDTGYWKIDIDYQCIYADYHAYLNIVKDKKKLNMQMIKQLSAITQRGNFLSNIEYEWLDTFKSDISNDVIDTYLHFAHSGEVHSPEFLVELANFIFYFDPVNEEAMVIKCKALSALGKHSLAKNAFESFVKEYKVIYDEEFKKDFHTVLE